MKATTLVGIGVALVGAWLLLRGAKEPSPSTQEILDEYFADFTASVSELQVLTDLGYPLGSRVYEEAIDIAYNKAAEGCAGTVAWSSVDGYYCPEG